MSGRLSASLLGCGLLGLGMTLGASGCADSDACKGQPETCLSLTLSGENGVAQADRLEVMVMRTSKPTLPMMALDSPKALPVKVAVLWPDGPGTVSVRSYLAGQLNGVSPELTLDLRNGDHDQRKLALFPPIDGTALGDLGSVPPRDMATPPRDMATPPRDMATLPPDMTMSPPDMAAPPPDLTMPPSPDMTSP